MSKASTASKTTTNTKVGDFVLNNDAEYDWTVYPNVPGAKGKREKLRIGARFKHVTAERRVSIMEEYRDRLKTRAKPKGDDGIDLNDDDEVDAVKELLSFEGLLLEEVLVDFKHVRDTDGNEVACTSETKAQLISNSWARSALIHGYMQSLQSRDDTGN